MHDLIISQTPTPLGRQPVLALTLRHRYTLQSIPTTGRWLVHTAGYSYALSDRDGRELFLYQWDTTGSSPIITPHVHVGRPLAHPGLPSPFRQHVERLVKAHLPTGYVTLAEVLRVTITDLGVVPLREDWPLVLDRAERTLRASLPRDQDGG